MNTLTLKPIVLAIGALSLGLSGCGGNNQDSGTPNRVNISGLAIDGYVARAEVFQDINNNGIRDAFEALRFTDNDGYYGYNPLTDINYCSTDTSQSLRERHCLSAVVGDYPVIIRGGYDLNTSEPFHGNLRSMIRVVPGRSTTAVDIISPLTTLLSYVPDNQKAEIKTKLGITDSHLNRDFFNRSADILEQSANIPYDQELIRLTQQIHKTISAASKIAEQTYKVKDEKDLPSDTTSFFYKSLAAELTDPSVANINDITEDTTRLISLMTQAKTQIEAAYTQKNRPIPSGAAALDPTILNTDSLNSITVLSRVIDAAIAQMPDSIPTQSTSKTFAKAIEVAVEKINRNRPTTDVQAIITALNDDTHRPTLLDELAKPSTNILNLVDIDLSNTGSVLAVTTVDYDGIFVALGNKRLVLGESNLQAQQDFSAVLFFSTESGENEANSGSLVACARYIDGLKDNGNLKSSGTLGTQTNAGSWSILNDGYALVLDLELAGARKQATIQFGGPNGDNNEEFIYRTDIGNGLQEWTGPGLTTYDPSVTPTPTNDAQCKTLLDDLDPINPDLLNQITGI